jgi:hypothetical protein
MFSAPASNRVYKITCSCFEMALQTNTQRILSWFVPLSVM